MCLRCFFKMFLLEICNDDIGIHNLYHGQYIYINASSLSTLSLSLSLSIYIIYMCLCAGKQHCSYCAGNNELQLNQMVSFKRRGGGHVFKHIHKFESGSLFILINKKLLHISFLNTYLKKFSF